MLDAAASSRDNVKKQSQPYQLQNQNQDWQETHTNLFRHNFRYETYKKQPKHKSSNLTSKCRTNRNRRGGAVNSNANSRANE